MDAKARGRILSIPGMRSLCDILVNAGNKRYVKALGSSRDLILSEMTSHRNSDRCFIVGSGPSLTATDLDSIASEDSFAANHIFNIFSKTLWRPTYYVLQDRYTKLDRSLSSIECRYLFIGSYFLRKNDFSLPDNAYPFFDKRDIGKREYLSFSESLEKFISVNYTVTYSMLQIAVALGYSEIYLLGMDHSYAVETNEKGAVVKRNNVRNHAYEDKQEVVANVQGMNKAYLSAKHYIDGHKDVSIYNATRGGKLEIFPRISLEEVIGA